MNILFHGVLSEEFCVQYAKIFKEKNVKIYSTEGRPQLTGLNINAKRLLAEGLHVTMISDNMIAFLLSRFNINFCILFYLEMNDREMYCQIGSSIVVACCNEFNIPVYYSITDKKDYKETGEEINLFYFNNTRIAPENIKGYVPLIEKIPFDNMQAVDAIKW